VQYNEQKVTQEQARFLDAHNFLQEKEELTIRDKLQRFRDLTILNERSRKHCIHMSVNFPPKDELSDLQMKRIAADFMRAIDFGDQPWLLYRHVDVGHPHMHIVTVNIRPDGSRISNDRRSPHFLQQTCFQLEQRYGLTPMFRMPDLFNGQQETPQQKVECSEPRQIKYGEKPTKNAIAEVLEYVNQAYAFTSFDAYNAVLSHYNVRADRGREDSPMYLNKGLYYRVIDAQGKKLGAPIKASAFHMPVTMERLEEKYQLSQQRVQGAYRGIRSHIDYVLAGNPQPYSLHRFWEELRRSGATPIVPAIRQRNPRGWEQRAIALVDPNSPKSEKLAIKPDDGHGFFYFDRSDKTIVRDTELGERYTAAAILGRTGIENAIRQMQDGNYFQLSVAQKAILSPGYPDTAETRRLLLQLSPWQSQVVQKQLELKQEQEQVQRQSHRMRHSL
jgi:Relaxase/Mobilisation nuclease domain